MARPRSERAHEAVLAAALKLIAEKGIDVTSVDAIAELSGVSKATIYKYWRTKESLCLEAISQVSGGLPAFDSGDSRSRRSFSLALSNTCRAFFWEGNEARESPRGPARPSSPD